MTRFSPLAAALEGPRMVVRERGAVIYWIAVWMFALIGIGAIKALTPGALPNIAGGRGGAANLWSSFGPFAVILVPLLLALWIMTIATVFRAVLTPGEHGWHLLKLGPDEARIAVVTAALGLGALVFGGVPAYLLFVLAKPFLDVAPGLSELVPVLGALATVAIEFWIFVRLSLIAARTFAEGHFHLAGDWRLTRGHFWRLFAAYVIVALEILALLLLLAIAALIAAAAAAAIGAPHGLDIVRRGLLWGLVAVAALIAALLFVGPTVLIYACQAYAFRAIRDGEARVAAMLGPSTASPAPSDPGDGPAAP